MATECIHKLDAPTSYTQNFQETTPACGQRDYKTQKKKNSKKKSKKKQKRFSFKKVKLTGFLKQQ